MAAGFGKREPIDRSVSADAWNAAEQGIAGDLSGDKTCVELENDSVARNFAEIIRIMQLPIEDSQPPGSEPKRREQARAFGSVEIKNSDFDAGGLAQFPGD